MKRLAIAALVCVQFAVWLVAGPAWSADSLAKVRATIATHDANEAVQESTQDARLKALEAAVATLQAQTAQTASTSVPVASVVYPKGVAVAGLQAVFDARPGLAHPTTKTFACAQPAPQTTADVDATGCEVYFNGGAFALDNWRFAKTPGLYTFAVGHINGGPLPAQLTLTNSIVDQANANSYYGSVQIGRGSAFTASKVSFLHAASTNLNIDGNTSLTDVYFDSPGQNPAPDGHTEGPHYYSGVHTVLRGMFDARNMAGHNTHATGQLYVEAANGNTDVTIKDSIFAGTPGIGIYSPIQIAAKVGGLTATIHLENVVLQAGNYASAGGRYVLPVGGTVKIVCHLCRDYDTGEIVDSAVNAQTP